jgi:hypothetical protein
MEITKYRGNLGGEGGEFFCLTEELLKYHLMKNKIERNSRMIVNKSIENDEYKLSCERELCRKVDMA